MTRIGISPSEAAPVAAIETQHTVLHGSTLSDPYAYFRNPEDHRVRQYLDAECAYADRITTPMLPLKELLTRELRRRVEETEQSVPQWNNGYWYYIRAEADREYPLHCRRKGSLSAAEEVYIDENILASTHAYFDLVAMDMDAAQQVVAYLIDTVGDERYQLRFRDIASGRDLPDVIESVSDCVVWTGGGAAVLYVSLEDSTDRPCAVWLHRLGTTRGEDICLYTEKDTAFFVSVWGSRSGRYVFIECQSNTTSEVRVLEIANPRQEPKVIRPRQTDIEYYVDHHEDKFLIVTNDQAENFRLMSVPVDVAGCAQWHEVLPERTNCVLRYVEPYAGFVVVGELHLGLDRIGILDPGTGQVSYLDFDDGVYALDVEDQYNYRSQFLRLNISSLHVPEQVWDCSPHTGRRILRKREVVSGYNPDDYATERLWVSVADASRVPVSIVYRKDRREKGGNPLLLVGYGAYGECLDVDFDGDLVSLLDRGIVVAYAHVRGGGELGQRWHRAGNMHNKENGIDDFIHCARRLVESGYARLDAICTWGASAGGLLVAAAAQRAPQLFRAVVAEVPFVDVINTLIDDSQPLADHDIEEFGDPLEPAEYTTIARYCPYHNVRRQALPHMLITAGLRDQRVPFWQPLKWTARLRACKDNESLLLLKLDQTGHSGPTGRYESTNEVAEIYAFLLTMWQID